MSHSEPVGRIEDGRGEARRPCPEGALDAQLRPAQPVRVRRHERAVVGERAAALREPEDLGAAAAAGPAIAGREAAGILDGLCARPRSRSARTAPPWAPGRTAGDDRVGGAPQVAGWDRGTRRWACQPPPRPPRIGRVRVHDDRQRLPVAERRDAADDEAGRRAAPRRRSRGADPVARRARRGARCPRGRCR